MIRSARAGWSQHTRAHLAVESRCPGTEPHPCSASGCSAWDGGDVMCPLGRSREAGNEWGEGFVRFLQFRGFPKDLCI